MDIKPAPYRSGQVGFPPMRIADGETVTAEADYSGVGLLCGEKLVVQGYVVVDEVNKKGLLEGASGIITSLKADGAEQLPQVDEPQYTLAYGPLVVGNGVHFDAGKRFSITIKAIVGGIFHAGLFGRVRE